MNWPEARNLAQLGKPVRRQGWMDRWVSYDRALWWITPYNPATGVSGAPRVVQATDWSAAEFTATDWTITDIPRVDPTVWVANAAAVVLPVKVYRTGGYVDAASGTWSQPSNAPTLMGVLASETDAPIIVPSGTIPGVSGQVLGRTIADVEGQAIDALGRNVWYGHAGIRATNAAVSVMCSYADCSLTPFVPPEPPLAGFNFNTKQWTGDPPA